MNPEEELVCMECNAEQDDCTCATCENCMANFSHADQLTLFSNIILDDELIPYSLVDGKGLKVWLCESCAEELNAEESFDI